MPRSRWIGVGKQRAFPPVEPKTFFVGASTSHFTIDEVPFNVNANSWKVIEHRNKRGYRSAVRRMRKDHECTGACEDCRSAARALIELRRSKENEVMMKDL
jgi:hypothetical protein